MYLNFVNKYLCGVYAYMFSINNGNIQLFKVIDKIDKVLHYKNRYEQHVTKFTLTLHHLSLARLMGREGEMYLFIFIIFFLLDFENKLDVIELITACICRESEHGGNQICEQQSREPKHF